MFCKLAYDFNFEIAARGRLRVRAPRVVKKFRYLGDGLFLFCSLLYALNRWIIKPHVHSRFMHDHFNDLWLMPCALPPLLLMQRWLRLRDHDDVPSPGEIALYFCVWSVLLEGIGPRIVPWHTTADPWDVVAYAFGGMVAALWWHRDRLFRPRASHEL